MMCNCKIGVVCEECLERNIETLWSKVKAIRNEALSQEVVLQKRIEELKRGLKAAWNVANLAANGNIKMKSIIAERKERITELKWQLAADDLAFEHANTVIKKYMDDLSPSPCGVKGHRKVDWTDWTERRAGERRVETHRLFSAHICTPYSDCAKLHPGRIGMQRIHAERRITSLRGHCARCGEVEGAKLEAIRPLESDAEAVH
jgi:hypothetical protein